MADRAAEWLLGIAAVLLNPDGGERLGGTRASLKGQALQAAQGLKTRQLTMSMQSVEGAGQEDRFAYFTEKLGGLAAWENVGLLERLKGLVREYMDALGAQCQAREPSLLEGGPSVLCIRLLQDQRRVGIICVA